MHFNPFIMRKFVFTLLFIAVSFSVFSQFVSLSKKEITSLRGKIALSQTNKKIFSDFEKIAASYLSDQATPLDTIRTEGLLKGNPKKIKTQNALADMNKMFVLALQYRLAGDQQYLTKCVYYLNAWAAYNQPNGNPIDDTNIDKAVEAYDLIKNKLSEKEKIPVEKWLLNIATTEINSKRMKAGSGIR